MTTPDYGPCEDWPYIQCAVWPTGSAGVTGYAVSSASLALWAATGQVFGLCERTIRPCRSDCADRSAPWWEWTADAGWPRPLLYRGNWFNIMCGSCPGSCSCVGISEARLPGPVHSIVQVKLNGEVLSATGVYRLDDGVMLTRIDGGVWPTCQDMAAADTEDNTWSVTARFGLDVPVLGQQAVGELAAEIANACTGAECRLPPGVTTLARQGVTIDFGNMNDIAERLYFCGLFINAVNPKRLQVGAEVYNIDAPGGRWAGS